MLKWSLFLNLWFQKYESILQNFVWGDLYLWIHEPERRITSTCWPFSQAGRLTGCQYFISKDLYYHNANHYISPLLLGDVILLNNEAFGNWWDFLLAVDWYLSRFISLKIHVTQKILTFWILYPRCQHLKYTSLQQSVKEFPFAM